MPHRFFSSRRRHTRCSRDWSSDVCSSDLPPALFERNIGGAHQQVVGKRVINGRERPHRARRHNHPLDRKSTRLNSSHGYISYAVFCLKKKKLVLHWPSRNTPRR